MPTEMLEKETLGRKERAFRNRGGLSMSGGKKFLIEVNEKQLALLEMVCDRYARLIEGQLSLSLQEICENAWEKRNKTPEQAYYPCDERWYEMRRRLEATLAEMKWEYWGLSRNQLNGVGYDDTADTIWDMYQVMRHARYLAWDKERQEAMRGTVMAHDAMRYGSQPLIKVELIKEK